MTEPPKFKFLDDSCASEDLTEDKTHQRIADQLHDLIVSGHPDGMTLGLEGDWGSGKSTVIELLRQKLESGKKPEKLFARLFRWIRKQEKESRTVFFYIDAWEHEGDPLRRAFLEALIDKIETAHAEKQHVLSRKTRKNLGAIRDKISLKKSATRLTTLGIIMAAAGLLVPIGAELIATFASHVTLRNTGKPCWGFITGVALCLAPAIAFLFVKGLQKMSPHSGKQSSAIFSTEKSMDISLENERTSLEFSRYFHEILAAIKDDFGRIVMVIDNLDRIGQEDALRIWSTLQTFVQRKNPLSEQKGEIPKWIVVPYAEEGLGRIWADGSETCNAAKEKEKEGTKKNDKETRENHEEKPGKNRAASFMDKSFDLQFRVPKFVVGDWQTFAKHCIQEAAPGLSDEDSETILNVLSWTRDDLADVPSPRQIKRYVNHVGQVWRIHADHASLTSVCFYVILKHFMRLSDAEIEREILYGLMFRRTLPSYVELDVDEVTAIMYGVTKVKATRLLLGQIIDAGLRDSATEQLRKWRNTFGEEVFDTVACHVLGNALDSMAPKYIASIQRAFPTHEPKMCEQAFQLLQKNSYNAKGMFAHLEHIDALALIEFASRDSGLAKKLADIYIQQLPSRFADSTGTSPRAVSEANQFESGKEVVEKIRQVSRAARQEIKLPYAALNDVKFPFQSLHEKCMDELAACLENPDEADGALAKQIRQGIAIESWLGAWLSALIRHGMRRIDHILEAIEYQLDPKNHPGVMTIGDKEHHVWELLLALDILPRAERPVVFIQKMLREPLLQGTANVSHAGLLYLLTKYRGDELAEDGHLEKYEEAWTTFAEKLGFEIFIYSAHSGEYDWLAREAARSNRQLARNIIQAALRADEKRLFDITAPYKFLVHAWNLTDGKMHDVLLQIFVSNENRLERLGVEGGESLTASPEVCRVLLRKCSEMPVGRLLFAKCIGELQTMNKCQWREKCKNTETAKLLEFLEQCNMPVKLGKGFAEGFTDILIQGVAKGKTYKGSYKIFVTMHHFLDETCQKDLATLMGSKLLEAHARVPEGELRQFLVEIPDYSEWLQETQAVTGKKLKALAIPARVPKLELFSEILARQQKHGTWWESIRKTVSGPVAYLTRFQNSRTRKSVQRIISNLGLEGTSK